MSGTAAARGTLLGVALLLGGAEALMAQAATVVRGRVEDAYTRDPLSGARVTVSDSSAFAFTDSLGAFSVRVRPGSPLALDVELFGYVSRRFEPDDVQPARVQVLRLTPAPFEMEELSVVEQSALTELLSDLRGRRMSRSIDLLAA